MVYALPAWARFNPHHGKDGKFSSGGGGSPAAMHDADQIAAAYTFTDPVTGYRTEVDGIHHPGDSNPDLNEWSRHRLVPPGRTMVTLKIRDADGNDIGQACRTAGHPGRLGS